MTSAFFADDFDSESLDRVIKRVTGKSSAEIAEDIERRRREVDTEQTAPQTVPRHWRDEAEVDWIMTAREMLTTLGALGRDAEGTYTESADGYYDWSVEDEGGRRPRLVLRFTPQFDNEERGKTRTFSWDLRRTPETSETEFTQTYRYWMDNKDQLYRTWDDTLVMHKWYTDANKWALPAGGLSISKLRDQGWSVREIDDPETVAPGSIEGDWERVEEKQSEQSPVDELMDILRPVLDQIGGVFIVGG